MASSGKIRTVTRWAWLVLALWVLAGVGIIVVYRRQLAPAWSAPRAATPVVVIESDDWGLDYEPPHFVMPSPTVDTRQAAGVARLARTLAGQKDAAGRPAIAGAFIVVHQADSAAIAADPNFAYHSLPIDRSMPQTVAALKQAAQQGVLNLVYHGRDHRDVGLWCQKIRRVVELSKEQGRSFDPEAVRTFQPRDPIEHDRINAEYFDSRTGYLEDLDYAAVEAKVTEGLAEFERIFGRRPVSTVPPRYLWGSAAEKALAADGIRYLHGVNKQGGRFAGADDVWSRPFGVKLDSGLIGIPRNTDVEVRPDNSLPDMATILAEADTAAASGQPIVICAHACNFATDGPELGEKMCDFLAQVLTNLRQRFPGLRYLSAEEAGTLAQTGEVRVRVGDDEHPVRLAGGVQQAYLACKDIYLRRAKMRLYVQVLAALAAATILLQAGAWRRRPKSGCENGVASGTGE